MSIIDEVRRVFGVKKNQTIVGGPFDSEALTMQEVADDSLSNTVEATQKAIHFDKEANLPEWLRDENILRDEGVIFGLSDAQAVDKINVIKHYFAHITAELDSSVAYYTEQIGEINLSIEQYETQINTLSEKIQKLEEKEFQTHQLPRTIAGFILTLFMCAGNYYIIDDSLTIGFPDKHWIIASGVFLAGMFNLFNPTSLFHDQHSRFNWRQALEEIGMPLAASGFVFAQVIDRQPLFKSLALFVFITFLFLFAGKLLLGNLTILKDDLAAWINNRKLENEKKIFIEQWYEKIAEYKKNIDSQRVEKWKIIDLIKEPEAAIKKFTEKREMLINIFESEFNLARNYRDKLSGEQIQDILNE